MLLQSLFLLAACLYIFLMPFLYCRSDGLRAIFLKSLPRDKATNAFHLDVT